MKNIFKIAFALSSALCVLSEAKAQEITDTIKVIDKANEIVVTRTGNTTKIIADVSDSINAGKYYIYEVEVTPAMHDDDRELPESWEINLPFVPRDPNLGSNRNKKIRREISGFEHIYWGWRFNYNDKQQVKNCFEVGVRHLIGVTWNRGRKTPAFSIGAGLGMMRFLAKDGYTYGKNGDAVIFQPIGNGVEVDNSRLDVWRFHVPVMMTIPLGKNGAFCLGGVVNLNTYASAVTQVYDGDYRNKIKYKGLQQNLITADIYTSISIGGVGVYATWSPTALFKNGYGPQLKSWSIGVDLISF